MAGISLDEGRMKEVLKDAMIEALHERKDMIYDVMAEVLEDFSLARAIEEGEHTETVSKKNVFQILQDDVEN